ncbi:MAG: NAD(P)-dependent oxidoreductase [Candidatus Yanofskybacteria bacterium]|nr:NAD(P)-dependent oxidoreductase [Candidatus Yanofskybacteria bacterium]
MPIIITGAKGTIGRVLRNLGSAITPVDLPEIDARNPKDLAEVFPGHDAVVHLAWNTATENWRSGQIDTDNILMAYNVYETALETGIPRVIMASSVHTDRFLSWKGEEPMSPLRIPMPTSPYGASKVFVEALGRYYAEHRGLQVVCIRFGGVTPQNTITQEMLREEPILPRVWLSHQDCVSLVDACLRAEYIPHNFVVVYGVSNNPHKLHDIANPFGWSPKDSSRQFTSN